MQKSLAIIFLITFLLSSVSAFADENEDSTIYMFDDDVVEGVTQSPQGAIVQTRTPGKTRSLVKVRTHFIPQMFKSVEDI
jgi:hypothetical protein